MIFAGLFVAGADLPQDRLRHSSATRREHRARPAAGNRSLVPLARQSFWIGAWLCISLTRPALPKSMSDIADSPTPDTSSTRPRPYLSWLYAVAGLQRDHLAVAGGRRAPVPGGAHRTGPALPTGALNDDCGASTRRQSMSSCGISRRKRDSGLSIGCPHDDRTFARLRYSRWRARVMPT